MPYILKQGTSWNELEPPGIKWNYFEQVKATWNELDHSKRAGTTYNDL